MTMNQISYHNMKENQRSNLAREGETHRSNVVSESIGLGNLAQRKHEYSDMAGYNKAVAVSKTLESTAKAADHSTKAAQRVFNPVSWFTGR